MISPFFPWFLAFLLLIACVALLVLLLRYRDRSVRLEAESRSWQERAEDRTQMLRRAEEVLKDSFAGISAEVLRNSEKQFLNLAETRLQSQRQQANHDLDSRKQAIESMLKPVSESLKLVQSRLGEMEKERVGAYTDLKTQIRYILSGNEALKNETARLSQALHHNSVRGQVGRAPTAPRGGTGGNGGVLRFHDSGNPFQGGGTGAAGHGHSPSWRPFHHH